MTHPTLATGEPSVELADLPFAGLDRRTLARLAPAFTRVHIPAGGVLVRHGDSADAVFIVLHGRLRVVLPESRGRHRVLGEVGRGETVGELGILTGDPRLGTVIAIRDSELVRLDRTGFEHLTASEPRAMLELMRQLVSRYRDTLREARTPQVSSIAILPLRTDPAIDSFIHELVDALRNTRTASGAERRVLHVDPERGRVMAGGIEQTAGLSEWLHDIELEHDLVVHEAEPDATAWTAACLRQADTILLIDTVRERAPGAAPTALDRMRGRAVRARTELVLLQEACVTPFGAAAWLEVLRPDAHHHAASGIRADVDRVARGLVGTSTGVVLGGGGARGLAHIGVLRALEEAGIPVDRIGGTSAGANIGAMHALGWSWERVLEETRRRFVDGGSLQDYTLPVHSLLRGARYHRIGDQLYGERCIEDLMIPFFCVSTNLTRGEAYVHRRGLVRRALRASMTVPGVAPAVFEGREVLVDGGVINNLPVDVMRESGPGRVLAVNVSPRQELRLDRDYDDTPSPWRSILAMLSGRAPRIPTIGAILTRAAAIPRAAAESDPARQPDLLLEPPVAGFRLLQWSAIDALVDIGYRHACERLERLERSATDP